MSVILVYDWIITIVKVVRLRQCEIVYLVELHTVSQKSIPLNV